jgi:hypothetical protein
MASVTGKQAAFVPAAAPLASTACGGNASPDFGASFNLRVVTFFVVLTCSSLGIVLPLVLRFRQSLAGISRSSWLFLAKAFGAGVILAVGIIHVFPDASTALGDPCLGARQGTAGTFPVYWCSRQHAFCYGQPLRLSHRAPPFVYARVLCGLIGSCRLARSSTQPRRPSPSSTATWKPSQFSASIAQPAAPPAPASTQAWNFSSTALPCAWKSSACARGETG